MVEATEQLIERHNTEWKLSGGRGIYPRWLTDVASAGAAASLSPEQVTRFDTELKNLLHERFPEDPFAVHHRVFAVICQTL